ncbi:MAG: S8 family peptidase [Planctomycetes bacterium]|nr:S8 family peptidase [Planctomycetota bacterium]
MAALERSLEQRSMLLSDHALGGEPEGVLVLEIAGNLDKFHIAAKAAGIEWLGEYDETAVEPDEDFAVQRQRRTRQTDGGSIGDEDEPEDSGNLVPRHVYLTATNQRRLRQFLAMWERWLRNQDFERGQKKWSQLFKQLRTVRFWDAEDRFRATGMLEVWQRAVDEDREPEPFAVELWFREDEAQRDAAEQKVRAFVTASEGQVIGRPTVIPEIAYHALIVSLPKQRVEALLRDQASVVLAKCDQVMLIRPTGQVVGGPTSGPPLQGIQKPASESVRQAVRPNPDLPPEIAILDGLPMGNHEALDGRLDIDDPDNWGAEYPVQARTHGTMVASNVIHGDLGAAGAPLTRRIYIRPIMRPRPGGSDEFIPPDLNEIDLVHGAVTRAKQRHPSLKVFLLAVCDPVQVFSGRISPWARLIDYLSHKHNILFVISSGNHTGALHYDVGTQQLHDMPPDQRDLLTMTHVLDGAITRGVMAPADSINALTVGAANNDLSDLDNTPSGTLLPVTNRSLPAPYSALGPGYRRAVKPDFLTNGGRKPYRPMLRSSTQTRLEVPDNLSIFPGIVTAIPHQSFRYRFEAGTTLAAALTTRRLAQALDYLRDPQFAGQIPDEFLPVIIKALVAHSARWDDAARQSIEAAVGNGADWRAQKAAVTRMLGYGYVPPEGTFDCAQHRATCIGLGTLKVDQGHEFQLPLPPIPADPMQQIWRRLTVTMAYLSPIKPRVQAYRQVVCWADRAVPDDVGFDFNSTSDVEVRAAQRGTLQHLVFEGNSAPVLTDGDALQLIVSSRPGAYDGIRADGEVSTRYGLVVSLEVAQNINIYDEIRDRIRPRVQVRNRPPSR